MTAKQNITPALRPYKYFTSKVEESTGSIRPRSSANRRDPPPIRSTLDMTVSTDKNFTAVRSEHEAIPGTASNKAAAQLPAYYGANVLGDLSTQSDSMCRSSELLRGQ
jgi:hypothetical protein